MVPYLLKFLDNLTNIYVRFNRKRLKGRTGEDDCRTALSTLYNVCLWYLIGHCCVSYSIKISRCHWDPSSDNSIEQKNNRLKIISFRSFSCPVKWWLHLHPSSLRYSIKICGKLAMDQRKAYIIVVSPKKKGRYVWMINIFSV